MRLLLLCMPYIVPWGISRNRSEVCMNLYTVLIAIGVLSIASLAIVTAFAVYSPLRKALPFYDPVADWVGHGIPDLGMLYMVGVMGGVLPLFIPFHWCVAFFVLSAGVFAFRLIAGLSFVWWQDILHLTGVLAKAYMFVAVAQWQEWITVLAVLYFTGIITLYVIRTYIPIKNGQTLMLGRILFNVEHIFMSIAAIIMFLLMQWPYMWPVEVFTMLSMCNPGSGNPFMHH